MSEHEAKAEARGTRGQAKRTRPVAPPDKYIVTLARSPLAAKQGSRYHETRSLRHPGSSSALHPLRNHLHERMSLMPPGARKSVALSCKHNRYLEALSSRPQRLSETEETMYTGTPGVGVWVCVCGL